VRFEDQRQILVNELRLEGIRDEAVLAAFLKVPRENYVLTQYKDYSYQNRPLPIEAGQTISQPLMIAIMMQFLELNVNDSVLEIGTGSGYQSALLAEIVKEVCSVERIEALSLSAQKALRKAGYRNIFFRIGDGHNGWQKAYPDRKEFSKIIVSAAADSIPERLTAQLSEGGKMAIPVGGAGYQILHIISRENGELVTKQTGGCSFVPLVNDDSQMR
jgi:protein-L-isoaspartate(D-aspartate) O-methyltransferase